MQGFVRVGIDGGSEHGIGWPGCPVAEEKTAGALSVSDAGLALDAAAEGFGHASGARAAGGGGHRGGPGAGRWRRRRRRQAIGWSLPCPSGGRKKVKALVAASTA